MRRMLILSVLLVVTASCTNGGETETTVAVTARQPGAAVQQWIDALGAGRDTEAHTLVEPAGLAVVIAVENRLEPDQLATLLTDGIPASLRASYWASFADSFATFRGMALSAVTVGEAATFDIEGIAFAAVTIRAGDGSGEVITRGAEDGTWQVDMVATVGPGLASAIADDLPAGLESDGGGAIAAAYHAAVIPGLSAALARDASNRSLVFDIEYIVQLLAQHPEP